MNRNKSKEITRADVAALAGVSGMTVSRVLNNSSHVTESTRRAVLDACQKLKYRPNAFAAGLRSKKSLSIGVVVPTFKHTFYGRMLAALEVVMRQANYHIISMQLDPQTLNSGTEWDEIEFLLSRQIDGLILDVTLLPETEMQLLSEKIPLVFVDAPPALPEFDFIGTTDYEGMAEITRHLIAAGHSRISYVGGLIDSRTNISRRQGWESALREAGITPESNWIFQHGFNREDGIRVVEQHIEELKKCSAIVCANDYVASGVITQLYEAGFRVPDDFSITGFSDDEIASFSYPNITTYRQPIEKVAHCAGELLLQKINGSTEAKPVYQLISGNIVIRNSVINISRSTKNNNKFNYFQN